MEWSSLRYHRVLLVIQIVVQWVGCENDSRSHEDNLCPEGWKYFPPENICVVLILKPVRMNFARGECKESLNYSDYNGLVTREDIDLVTIRNEATNTFVFETAEEMRGDDIKSDGYIIGLNGKRDTEYKWIRTGEVMTYSHWSNTEPSDAGSSNLPENFTKMFFHYDGSWNDETYLARAYPLCDLVDADPCKTNNSGCYNGTLCVTKGMRDKTCEDINECEVDNGGCGDQICVFVRSSESRCEAKGGGLSFAFLLGAVGAAVILLIAGFAYYRVTKKTPSEDSEESEEDEDETEETETSDTTDHDDTTTTASASTPDAQHLR